jgi:hypothetical protein
MQDVPAYWDSPGFVVEWQLADAAGTEIDLSGDPSDSEVTLPENAPVGSGD